MDETLGKFIEDFGAVVRLAQAQATTAAGPTLTDVLAEHLGTDPAELAIVVESLPAHRYADADIVLESMAAADPETRMVGFGGGDQRHFSGLSDLLRGTPWAGQFPLAPPDYSNFPVGPDLQRRTPAFGLRLFVLEGVPFAVLEREASFRYNRPRGTFEVLAPTEADASRLLAELRRRMERESVFRGNVVALTTEMYGPGHAETPDGGATFMARPGVPAQNVILPEGLLERIRNHTLAIGTHAEELARRGQHLKRGLLLYGPPGTGKTHTVRHLIGEAPGTTVIMLAGRSLARVSEAASMARAFAPSLVVLEDVDLVAEDRSIAPGPQPLLFEILDALDGLEGDADVAFILTTNRAELLERALAQRPGRVDLAVELPLPALPERRRLLDLYGEGLGFSAAALDRAAALTEGTTAALAKELVRRAVLAATREGTDPGDGHLDHAASQLMDETEALTRSLLGSQGPEASPGPMARPGPFPGPPAGFSRYAGP